MNLKNNKLKNKLEAILSCFGLLVIIPVAVAACVWVYSNLQDGSYELLNIWPNPPEFLLEYAEYVPIAFLIFSIIMTALFMWDMDKVRTLKFKESALKLHQVVFALLVVVSYLGTVLVPLFPQLALFFIVFGFLGKMVLKVKANAAEFAKLVKATKATEAKLVKVEAKVDELAELVKAAKATKAKLVKVVAKVDELAELVKATKATKATKAKLVKVVAKVDELVKATKTESVKVADEVKSTN